MKIFNYLSVFQKTDKAYVRQSRAADERGPVLKKKDEVIFSSHVTDLHKFEELAETVPEVRQEKISAIKDQIRSKGYYVAGRLVAQSIADLLS